MKILEAEFSAMRSNKVEDTNVVQLVVAVFEDENEGGFVVTSPHKDEDFVECHLKVDHNVDGVL